MIWGNFGEKVVFWRWREHKEHKKNLTTREKCRGPLQIWDSEALTVVRSAYRPTCYRVSTSIRDSAVSAAFTHMTSHMTLWRNEWRHCIADQPTTQVDRASWPCWNVNSWIPRTSRCVTMATTRLYLNSVTMGTVFRQLHNDNCQVRSMPHTEVWKIYAFSCNVAMLQCTGS